MKLEKREITLNEIDSVQDIVQAEKWLLFQYVQSFEKATQKYLRNALKELMEDACKDLCSVCDLLHASAEKEE